MYVRRAVRQTSPTPYLRAAMSPNFINVFAGMVGACEGAKEKRTGEGAINVY